MSIKHASDARPELASPLALINYAGHFPAGTSVKSLEHFTQLVDTNEFQMYDYGTAELNKKYYGG